MATWHKYHKASAKGSSREAVGHFQEWEHQHQQPSLLWPLAHTCCKWTGWYEPFTCTTHQDDMNLSQGQHIKQAMLNKHSYLYQIIYLSRNLGVNNVLDHLVVTRGQRSIWQHGTSITKATAKGSSRATAGYFLYREHQQQLPSY